MDLKSIGIMIYLFPSLSDFINYLHKKNVEDLQPEVGAHNTIQKGVWSYKEKDNYGSQYYCEVKMGNFGNLYQLLKASFLHLKQQEHLSSSALLFLHILLVTGSI